MAKNKEVDLSDLLDGVTATSPDEFEAMIELVLMPRDELDMVYFTLKKWVCQHKGCTNGTKVRDYGVHPIYFSPRKNEGWRNINHTFWNCGKHWKVFSKLLKIKPMADVEVELLDKTKKSIIDL